MKLRNKKTGEINKLLGTKMEMGIIWLNIQFQHREPKAYCYNSLAELNEDWEDYKPVEPQIKDESVREIIKKWYNKNKIVGKLRSYGSESWLGLRGTDEYKCDWNIEMNVSYISLLKYYKLYSLDELIGEEEQQNG